MNIWKAALVGGAVFLAVRHFRRGDVSIPSAVDARSPGGTIPVPGVDLAAPPGGVGAVGSDPTIVPSPPAPANGGVGSIAPPGSRPSTIAPNVLTFPAPRPPTTVVRDHRTAPSRPSGVRYPSAPTSPRSGSRYPSGAPKGPTVACITTPCPTRPTSGSPDPYRQSVAIRNNLGFGRSPVVY